MCIRSIERMDNMFNKHKTYQAKISMNTQTNNDQDNDLGQRTYTRIWENDKEPVENEYKALGLVISTLTSFNVLSIILH